VAGSARLVDDDRIVAVDFDRFGRAEDELHDGPGVGVRDTVVAVFHVLGGEFACRRGTSPLSEGERVRHEVVADLPVTREPGARMLGSVESFQIDCQPDERVVDAVQEPAGAGRGRLVDVEVLGDLAVAPDERAALLNIVWVGCWCRFGGAVIAPSVGESVDSSPLP